MTLQTTETPRPRSFLRSAAAILLGLVTVFALSLATDQVFHALGIYPPWGQPMQDNRLNALALAYRCIYAIVGSAIAARFAPHSPLRHALILGAIGFVISAAGTIAMWDFGPNWFPVALTLSSLPCAWIGGKLQTRKRRR